MSNENVISVTLHTSVNNAFTHSQHPPGAAHEARMAESGYLEHFLWKPALSPTVSWPGDKSRPTSIAILCLSLEGGIFKEQQMTFI